MIECWPAILAAMLLLAAPLGCSRVEPHRDPIGVRLERPGQRWAYWELVPSGRFAHEVAIPVESDRVDLGRGGGIEMDDGELHGVLRLGWHSDLPRGIGGTKLIAVQFDFVDAAGGGWRYECIVGKGPFLHNEAVPLAPVERTTSPGLLVSHPISGYGSVEFLVDAGERGVVPVAGRNPALKILPVGRGGVLESQWSMFAQDALAKKGMLFLRSEMPVESLLWRRAPIFGDGAVEVEAADWVDVRPLASAPQGLARSPVRVTAPEQGKLGGSLLAHLRLEGDPPAPEALSDQAGNEAAPGTRFTKRVSIPIREAQTISYGAPPAVSFEPGMVVGDLRIEALRTPRGVQEMPWTLTTFDFRDQDGRGWRHVCVSTAYAFWPPEPAAVASGPADGELRIVDSLDGRDEAYFDLDTGERITVRLKYFSFEGALMSGGGAGDVRVRAALCPVFHPRSVQSHLHIEYDVPAHDLLWRRASGLGHFDWQLEDGNFIDLRPLAKTDPTLPRSPVRVIDDRVVEAVNPGRHDPDRRYFAGKVVHLKENAHTRYPNTELASAIEFRTTGGRRMVAGPGRVIGHLFFEAVHAEKQKPVDERLGLIRAAFTFATRDRVRCVYAAFFRAADLWPSSPVSPPDKETNFSAHATVICALDTRELPPLMLADGTVLTEPSVRELVKLEVASSLQGARIRLSVGLREHERRGPELPARVVVEYIVPLEQLLWKPGHLGTREAPIPQAAEGVSVMYLGSLDNPGIEEDFVESAVTIDLGPAPLEAADPL